MSPPAQADPPFGRTGGVPPGPPQGHPWGPPAPGRPDGEQPSWGQPSWGQPSWAVPSPYPQGPSPYPQHPQGPPPWGPPSPAPGPRRSRSGAGRLAVVLALLVLLGALVLLALLAFVTGPRFARVDVLDRAAVERGVSDVVTRDWRRTVTGVTCPEGVRARAGESFVCSATVDGRPRRVPVDVLDERGTYQVGQPR